MTLSRRLLGGRCARDRSAEHFGVDIAAAEDDQHRTSCREVLVSSTASSGAAELTTSFK